MQPSANPSKNRSLTPAARIRRDSHTNCDADTMRLTSEFAPIPSRDRKGAVPAALPGDSPCC